MLNVFSALVFPVFACVFVYLLDCVLACFFVCLIACVYDCVLVRLFLWLFGCLCVCLLVCLFAGVLLRLCLCVARALPKKVEQELGVPQSGGRTKSHAKRSSYMALSMDSMLKGLVPVESKLHIAHNMDSMPELLLPPESELCQSYSRAVGVSP